MNVPDNKRQISGDKIKKLNILNDDWLENRLKLLFLTEDDYYDFITNYWDGINGNFHDSLDDFRVDRIMSQKLSFETFIEQYNSNRAKALEMLFLDVPPYGYDNAVIKWLDQRLEEGEKIENLFLLKKLNPHVSYDFFLLGSKQLKRNKPKTFQDCLTSHSKLIKQEYGVEIKLPEDNVYSITNDVSDNDLFEYETNRKKNQFVNKVTIHRLVRDSIMARNLRSKYNCCQLCHIRLRDSKGGVITEAHHVKPYNRIHRGDDNIKNLIVLCPNCHSQFDCFYYALNPESLKVHCIFEDDINHNKKLMFIEGHSLDEKYLEYAWNIFTDK